MEVLHLTMSKSELPTFREIYTSEQSIGEVVEMQSASKRPATKGERDICVHGPQPL
jgi:hypothetical protein